MSSRAGPKLLFPFGYEGLFVPLSVDNDDQRAVLEDRLRLLAAALDNNQFTQAWHDLDRSNNPEQTQDVTMSVVLFWALGSVVIANGWNIARVKARDPAIPFVSSDSVGLCDWERRILWVRKSDPDQMLVTLAHEEGHRRLQHKPAEYSRMQDDRYNFELDMQLQEREASYECQAEAIAHLVTEYFGVSYAPTITYLARQSNIGRHLISNADAILTTASSIINDIEHKLLPETNCY